MERVGISGWRYPSWRGDFYPAGLPQRAEFSFAAAAFDTLELNGTFYSLQRPTSYRRWYEQSPSTHKFAVKGSRLITHLKRLVDVDTELANFFASGLLALREKLGPVLWQLPESTVFDAEVLDTFLDRLPRTTSDLEQLARLHDNRLGDDRVVIATDCDRPVRHAIEVRNASFDVSAFYAILEKHGVACVLADTAGRFPVLDHRTADISYLRLHGEQRMYGGGYSDESLERWAESCRRLGDDGDDVFVYFDNDSDGRAPHDARRLRALLDPRPPSGGS